MRLDGYKRAAGVTPKQFGKRSIEIPLCWRSRDGVMRSAAAWKDTREATLAVGIGAANREPIGPTQACGAE